MEKNAPITTDHAGRTPEEAPDDTVASVDLPQAGAPIGGSCRELTAFDHPDAWRENPSLRRHRLLQLDDSGRAQAGRYTFDLHPGLVAVIDPAVPPDEG